MLESYGLFCCWWFYGQTYSFCSILDSAITLLLAQGERLDWMTSSNPFKLCISVNTQILNNKPKSKLIFPVDNFWKIQWNLSSKLVLVSFTYFTMGLWILFKPMLLKLFLNGEEKCRTCNFKSFRSKTF